MPGEDWDRAIRKALAESHVILLCLSTRSVTKVGYVQREFKLAKEAWELQPAGTIFLLPVRLDSCQVPAEFRHLQYANLFEANGYQKLTQSLKARAEQLGLVVQSRKDALQIQSDPSAEDLIKTSKMHKGDPINEAKTLLRLIKEFGYTQQQLGKATGQGQPAIAKRLRLLRLPVEVQRLVSAGKLTASHALALMRYTEEPNLIIAMANIAVNRRTTVRVLEAGLPPQFKDDLRGLGFDNLDSVIATSSPQGATTSTTSASGPEQVPFETPLHETTFRETPFQESVFHETTL